MKRSATEIVAGVARPVDPWGSDPKAWAAACEMMRAGIISALREAPWAEDADCACGAIQSADLGMWSAPGWDAVAAGATPTPGPETKERLR